MAYYLGRYAGAGTGFLDPFRPEGVTGPFSSVDLRPDSTLIDGRCLVWTPNPVANPLTHGLIELGDDARPVLSLLIRRRIENALGITFDGDGSIGDFVGQLLTTHARTDRTRWKPLRFHRGTVIDPSDGLTARYRGIYLGPRGERVWEQFYKGGPGTVYNETWDSAGDSDNPDGDLNWTEQAGDWDVVSNRIHLMTTNADSALRAEHDLASDDHYVEAEFKGTATTEFPGLLARFSSSAYTGYQLFWESGAGDQTASLYKFNAGTSTVITGDTVAPGAQDTTVIRLEVNGSDLEGFRNGVSGITGTDSDITGNLRTGLAGWLSSGGGSGNLRWDNFESGDLVATSLVDLYPTADGTDTDVVDEGDATTDLYASIDDDPGSPSDSDWNNNTDDAGQAFYEITNMPSGFGTAISATILVRYRGQEFDGTGTVTLYARLYQSDESTPLSDEVQVAQVTADTSFANTSAITLTGIVASNKTTWDGARLRLRWART